MLTYVLPSQYTCLYKFICNLYLYHTHLTQIPVLVRQLRLPGQRSDKDLLRPNLGTTEESVTD